jgi:hypothetical protein
MPVIMYYSYYVIFMSLTFLLNNNNNNNIIIIIILIYLMFCGPCIVVYLYNKDQQDALPILPAASRHKRMTYTNCYIYRIVPPDDEQ